MEKATSPSVGLSLLELLGADQFASYVWDDAARRFGGRVMINMREDTLARYEAYYQFHDPITHVLHARRVPTLVTQVMPQRELMRTEFFNDFLARDGRHWGVNVYAWADGRNIGDLRIWRSRRRLAAGLIDEAQFFEAALASAPSAGHCNTMGTASTMNAVAEVLGMSLPGCAAIPAPYRERAQMVTAIVLSQSRGRSLRALSLQRKLVSALPSKPHERPFGKSSQR